MDLSDSTLQALRFEEVRTALASRTRTEAGKARAQTRAFLPGRVESNLTQRRTCGSCGWEGSVSKHKPKCPKCGTAFP